MRIDVSQYDLGNYLRAYTSQDGRFHLRTLGIYMQTEGKIFPYFHTTKNGSDNSFPIDIKALSQNGNLVKEYSYPKTDSTEMNQFLSAFAESIAFYDLLDPFFPRVTEEMDRKIDGFLEKHLGMDYKKFRSKVDYESFNSADFDILTKNGIKRRLFDYRARIYLSALASVDEMKLESLLGRLQGITIYPIKKIEKEPVFDCIVERLKRQ